MAKVYGYTVKGIKTFVGCEGYGIQGEIYYGKKEIAWYSDSGDGGTPDIEIIGTREQQQDVLHHLKVAADRYYAEHPQIQCFEFIPKHEQFISEIILLIEDERAYKRLVKLGYGNMLVYSVPENGIVNRICLMTEEAVNNFIGNSKVVVEKIYKNLSDFIIE